MNTGGVVQHSFRSGGERSMLKIVDKPKAVKADNKSNNNNNN